MRARIAGKPRAFSPFRWVTYFVSRWLTERITARHLAEAPEPIRILAHRPLLLCAYGAMEMGLMWSRSVDPRLKELARAKAGTIHGCPW